MEDPKLGRERDGSESEECVRSQGGCVRAWGVVQRKKISVMLLEERGSRGRILFVKDDKNGRGNGLANNLVQPKLNFAALQSLKIGCHYFDIVSNLYACQPMY
ncbi:purple acid phosphatase 2 [Corchorus olitorius]|uniref:Purple acid phosphatase 2 n=1 Tax=Corchorus olitorius TaxID=93759 RepID=A0A1R3FZN6_9ROSI|nr:purple acid phosphatase 2 [Corchorus olitorius]